MEKIEIDFKVGDWVETCSLLPGIVERIDYKRGDVYVFYPHYAFKYPSDYGGGSTCSVGNCGVHKISPQYACKLMALGEEKLKALWEEMVAADVYDWSDRVERCYHETIEKRYENTIRR